MDQCSVIKAAQFQERLLHLGEAFVPMFKASGGMALAILEKPLHSKSVTGQVATKPFKK